MRPNMIGSAVAALVGAALTFMSPLPASAQLARPHAAVSISGHNNPFTEVQWRRGGYGWRGGSGWHGYRGYGYRPWVGAGVGLATGLAVGSALAAPYYYAPPSAYYDDWDAPLYYRAPSRVGGDATAYCMQRFRSYDPYSGTYLGFDGRRHPCP